MRPLAVILFCLAALSGSHAAESRLSAAVAVTTTAAGSDAWLAAPEVSYIEAWFRFPPTLSESTLFGLDQELLDGLDDPDYVPGGDWMAFTGVQRTGVVWVAVGDASTQAGTPSTARTWRLFPLGQALAPDTWYRLRSVADFSLREFVRFEIDGPGLARTIDLSGVPLDYPNYMPFDRRAMTWYAWALDGTGIGGSAAMPSAVYVDDVAYGFLADAGAAPEPARTISDDLESGAAAIPAQPPASGTIAVADYVEASWYLERDEALVGRVNAAFARSGHRVIVCDAALADQDRADWLLATRTALNSAPVPAAQALSTTAETGLAVVLAGSDADGDGLTWSVLSGPTHGTLTGTAPALTYLPDAGYRGTDAVLVQASDGLATGSATITIRVGGGSGDPGGGGGGCGGGSALGLIGAGLAAGLMRRRRPGA